MVSLSDRGARAPVSSRNSSKPSMRSSSVAIAGGTGQLMRGLEIFTHPYGTYCYIQLFRMPHEAENTSVNQNYWKWCKISTKFELPAATKMSLGVGVHANSGLVCSHNVHSLNDVSKSQCDSSRTVCGVK